jgi:FkbM family methyltransferase
MQIFLRLDYASPLLPKSAEVIVDLGANIGLATVFFGTRYPEARILSVEPEAANFAMLAANTAALGDRVQRRQAAVWTRDGFVKLRTQDDQGRPLEAWGVQVADETEKPEANVACNKLTTLLNNANFHEVDILKIDIEGAELEIFSESTFEWLPRVKLILIETHDRFRPGTESAVRFALLSRFEELPRSGENLIFRRK